ncbi:hypothetical protein KFU94_12350 [Chloroflexi bacterium TSY]|nr:hypothetical protein [Chloroflexi bacterium TSY]
MAEMFNRLPEMMPKGALGSMITFYHNDGWEDQDIDAEVGFLVSDIVASDAIEISDPDVQIRTLPAVETMVTVVRVCHASNALFTSEWQPQGC